RAGVVVQVLPEAGSRVGSRVQARVEIVGRDRGVPFPPVLEPSATGGGDQRVRRWPVNSGVREYATLLVGVGCAKVARRTEYRHPVGDGLLVDLLEPGYLCGRFLEQMVRRLFCFQNKTVLRPSETAGLGRTAQGIESRSRCCAP